MKRAGLVLAMVGLVACGVPVEEPPAPSPPPATTLTASPTITGSVGVGTLMAGDPCALVGLDIRGRLDVPDEDGSLVDEGYKGCRWGSEAGTWLAVSVKAGEDPLADHYERPGVEVTEVGGFPAILWAEEADYFCQIWVKTAPTQGFWVVYGKSPSGLDVCEGARTVAEYLTDRVREG